MGALAVAAVGGPKMTTDGIHGLEEQIFQRLSQRQRLGGAAGDAGDAELLDLIYRFLYVNLRRVAAVLPGMGQQARDVRQDASCRFTEVYHEAFVRILEKYPDKLMQARTRSELTGYVSKAMVNLLVDRNRRQSTWVKVAAALGLQEAEQQQTRDILTNLYDERAEYFEERTKVRFDEGLLKIQAWEVSADPAEREYAEILRKRYVDQLGYDQIGREMGLTSDEVRKTLDRAKYHLRK
ncbi:MAG: sigma factor [Planctomycetota bacterium]|jgi:DNA-directed RNA polymerase specialized sigma24 family protein